MQQCTVSLRSAQTLVKHVAKNCDDDAAERGNAESVLKRVRLK